MFLAASVVVLLAALPFALPLTDKLAHFIWTIGQIWIACCEVFLVNIQMVVAGNGFPIVQIGGVFVQLWLIVYFWWWFIRAFGFTGVFSTVGLYAWHAMKLCRTAPAFYGTQASLDNRRPVMRRPTIARPFSKQSPGESANLRNAGSVDFVSTQGSCVSESAAT